MNPVISVTQERPELIGNVLFLTINKCIIAAASLPVRIFQQKYEVLENLTMD